jgi:hypothetical protein
LSDDQIAQIRDGTEDVWRRYYADDDWGEYGYSEGVERAS